MSNAKIAVDKNFLLELKSGIIEAIASEDGLDGSDGADLLGKASERAEAEILRILFGLKSKPKHHIPRRLNVLCLDNPNIVASLVFGDKLDESIKERLLFQYSRDHTGSCRLSDNPQWAEMMRGLIVPRTTQLPSDFQMLIKWYQGHGL